MYRFCKNVKCLVKYAYSRSLYIEGSDNLS